jgi:hypothetical protein
MSCNSNANSVTENLWLGRTPADKAQAKEYNCAPAKRTIPQSLMSLLSPVEQKKFSNTKMENINFNYSLDPTKYTNSKMVNLSTGEPLTPKYGAIPCEMPPQNDGCMQGVPLAYPTLSLAYQPTVGPCMVNYGQYLNYEYIKQ